MLLQPPAVSALTYAMASGHSQPCWYATYPRHPLRIELLLVRPKPLEIVPTSAALEQQPREPFARVRTALLANGCERRHPEVESRVPPIPCLREGAT